jgi:hypothetical protein
MADAAHGVLEPRRHGRQGQPRRAVRAGPGQPLERAGAQAWDIAAQDQHVAGVPGQGRQGADDHPRPSWWRMTGRTPAGWGHGMTERLTVLDADPIAGAALAALRDERTTPPEFRGHAQRLGALLARLAVRDLPAAIGSVRTPLADAPTLSPAVPVVAVPVLRAGLGLLLYVVFEAMCRKLGPTFRNFPATCDGSDSIRASSSAVCGSIRMSGPMATPASWP